MEHYLEITATACFIGLVDPAAYQGFIANDVAYEALEKRVLQEMKQGNIVFWGSTTPNRWTVRLVDQPHAETATQEFQGHIQVSQEGLCLVNYAMLLEAAQFEEDALSEQYLELLPLAKGWYAVQVRQLFHPEKDALVEESLGFEIVLKALPKAPSSPVNALEEIPWSIY